MKKGIGRHNALKIPLAAALAGCVLLLATCKTAGDSGAAQNPEDYISGVTTIKEAIYEIDVASTGVDYEDAAAVREFVDSSKLVFEKLIALKSPEAFTEAQARLTEGASLMLEYYDKIPGVVEAGKPEDAREEIVFLYSRAVGALAEGYGMMDAPAPSP
jgi:hypothetical protein